MEITALTPSQVDLVNEVNEPFPLIGRFYPTLSRGRWSWEEELFSQPAGTKTNPPLDRENCLEYAKGDGQVLYLAWEDGQCLGHIAVQAEFMGWAYVEDLAVRQNSRGRGVGTALIQKAAQWARDRGLAGLRLETQDNNLQACRFYLKQGFQIGGANYLRYHTLPAPQRGEAALFFYLIF